MDRLADDRWLRHVNSKQLERYERDVKLETDFDLPRLESLDAFALGSTSIRIFAAVSWPEKSLATMQVRGIRP